MEDLHLSSGNDNSHEPGGENSGGICDSDIRSAAAHDLDGTPNGVAERTPAPSVPLVPGLEIGVLTNTHVQIPYDIEMYARYFLITLSDPSLNLPPSLMAGVAYTLGIMLSDFLVKEVLAEYPKWQGEQVYPFFTGLNLIFWYTVYFLLETDGTIDLGNFEGDR